MTTMGIFGALHGFLDWLEPSSPPRAVVRRRLALPAESRGHAVRDAALALAWPLATGAVVLVAWWARGIGF